MSIISSKNKIKTSRLQSSKNEENIPRIITVDFDKNKISHYFNYGYRKFNMITKTELILNNGVTESQTDIFKFSGINENIVPFIKIIPRFEVFLDENKLYTDITFRYEWVKLDNIEDVEDEDKLMLKIYMLYKLTPFYEELGIPSNTQFNLYYSLDLAIKSRLGASLTHGSQL